MRKLLSCVFVTFVAFYAMTVLGQTGLDTAGTAEDIALGGYSIPLILTVILGLVYKCFPKFPDRFKALLAAAVGIVIGIVAVLYQKDPEAVVTFKLIIDGILKGLMTGTAAVGLYEIGRSGIKPRK